MEAIAHGKDHHYFNHKPSSARPLFYAHRDNCNHDNAIEECSFHDYCGSTLGARAGSHGADGSGYNGEESAGSPNFTRFFMSEGRMSNRNGQGSANGYCSDAAAEQRLIPGLTSRAHSHTSVESCSEVENPQQISGQGNEELHDDKLVSGKITQTHDSVENCGKAENSQPIKEKITQTHDDKFVKEKMPESQDSVEKYGRAEKTQPIDGKNNEEIHDDKFVKEKSIQCQDSVENCGKAENSQPINGNDDEESHDDNFVKEKTSESQDSDFELIENFDSQHVSPQEAPENMEVLEYDVSQCYSPSEWSSRASTDSALSPLASPLLAAWPSPVFNRCRTAPIGPSSLNLEEVSPNFLRSKTDKERKQRSSEPLYHTPSPAERLSERKRKKIIENLVKIKNDGTVEVDVDRGSEIAPTLFDLDGADQLPADVEEDYKEPVEDIPSYLEIAMLIVGTRGDVQPFVAIGKRLKEKGYRVRLATHANFRNFVTSNGLEFYPLGGDPKILAGYMVKNKGFLPSGPSEISIQKKQLRAIMHSLLPACTKPDGDSGAPFRASAIIANPPAYGHVHVAEYLDVPLHIFFTMPWTPTNEFPHPLARVKRQAGYKMSYHVVDSLMWWGMRGLINEFRVKELKLNPMTYFNMNQGSIAHLPTGYMWSPHLVPKPKDWGPRVDVVGFCFLSLADNYTPPNDLVKWLAEGEKPIYVGFGSLPVEQPGKMTEIIVRALRETKHRGIIDKGWGGLGDLKEPPDSIFLLENCPHDWLFPQCAAVVHHGGAGTTAAGLKAGCPTTIVPFFGDQPFWGERVCAKGVGPAPIPVQQFTLERLVQAINFMQDPEVKQRALELAIEMEEEDGVGGAVDAFFRHWVGRSTQVTLAKERLSIFQRAFVSVQRLWCLPWCFE